MLTPAEIVRFDPGDPRLATDPAAFWSSVTLGAPRLPAGRHAVALWRYDEVLGVLEDRKGARRCPERALSAFPPGPFRDHNAATMAFLDPPDHGPVRRRFARAFAPRVLERLVPRIEEMSAGLLAELDLERETDLIAAYAERLPVLVIAAILGISVDREDALRQAAHAIVGGLEPGADAKELRAADAAVQQLSELLAPQFARPPEGSLFALLAESGDELPPDRLLHNAIFLLNAGHETTSRLIAGLARSLFADPLLASRVAGADRPAGADLAAGLVEETLRLDPPLHFVPRFLVHERHGRREATLAYLLIAAANRDPAIFAEPERLDPSRPNARNHLAFAAGPHLCLGATLARLEGAIAARHLAPLAPRLALAPGARRTTGRMFQGWSELPVCPRA